MKIRLKDILQGVKDKILGKIAQCALDLWHRTQSAASGASEQDMEY